MKESCILALLCGAEILCMAYSQAIGIDEDEDYRTVGDNLVKTGQVASTTAPAEVTTVPKPRDVITSTLAESTHISKAHTPPPVSDVKPITITTTTTSITTATPSSGLYRKECATHLMVGGGMIILCFILLMSILLLTWRVCKLTRRVKALGSRDELVSNSGYWTGTAKENKSEPAAEAKETSMLMADVGNGATKEEGEAAKEGVKEGEEEKDGKAAAGGGGEEDGAAAAEKKEDTTSAKDSSTPKQQEGSADSQPTETTEAPDSEKPKESV